MANLDGKLASIRNETKAEIQRLTIENDRLRNKEAGELEDLEEEVKNKGYTWKIWSSRCRDVKVEKC